MNVNKFIKSVTYPLSLLRSPVWLFDVDSLQLVWANAAAISLCDAKELVELQRHDMAFDLSCKVRERLNSSTDERNDINDPMSEYLTLYPDGQAVTFECSISAMSTPSGGRWLMVNGLRQITQSKSEALYSNQALLHTSVCVSVYSLEGQLKYSNPAASIMQGSALVPLAERFEDNEEWQTIQTSLKLGDEIRTEAKMLTASGHAWHSLTLEICPDPMLNESSILLTEVDISARRHAQDQIQQLAFHDVLTGLPNRALWNQTLNEMLDSVEQPLSVLFMDLNGFKAINDTYGHDAGDKLLVAVGMRISDCLGDDQFLARLGGDEFTVLMKDDKAGVLSSAKAEYILRALATSIQIDGHELNIAASIGISRYPTDAAKDAEQIMQQADAAMYAAKRAGCGVLQFEAYLRQQIQRRPFAQPPSTRSGGLKNNGNENPRWPEQSIVVA